MRTVVMLLCVVGLGGLGVLAPGRAAAQPDETEAPAGAGSDTNPAARDLAPAPAPARTEPPSAPRSPDELRQICAAAMNADPSFAESIAMTVNEQTVRQHREAATAIAKNERHVILAYAAMWVLAALFLVFLWRRQQHLNGEIAQLRRDLDAATRDPEAASPAG